MKICLVVPYDLAEQGGVKSHALQLARALRALGDEVVVMGASSRASDDPAIEVFGGIVNVRSNGSDNRIAILTPPWRIRSWLRAQAFDVVHVHEPLCPMLAPWAAMFAGEAARIATFHAFAEHEAIGTRMLRWSSGPVVLRHVDRAIAVSEPAARYARLVWRRELAIIPNGIELPAQRAELPDVRGGGPLRLLFVGHWRDARKGLTVLLEAVALLQARGVSVQLDVVGSGPSGAAAPALPGVAFHGPAASAREVATWLANSDVFVSPALGQESFGIVLLEAMAAARPLVCSDIEGYRQVVSSANARLVPPGSATELATAIAELAANPERRLQLAAANRERVAAFSWTSLAPRVRAEYVAALDQRTRKAAS